MYDSDYLQHDVAALTPITSCDERCKPHTKKYYLMQHRTNRVAREKAMININTFHTFIALYYNPYGHEPHCCNFPRKQPKLQKQALLPEQIKHVEYLYWNTNLTWKEISEHISKQLRDILSVPKLLDLYNK